MVNTRTLDEESAAVQKHLELTQSVIHRMAENSRSCKVWCVTLVSAVLVLVAGTGEPQHALIALAPTALFYLLDAYYLALERGFRRSYVEFVTKFHEIGVTTSDLYSIAPTGAIWRDTLWALLKSFSVPPFYLVVIATVMLTWLLIF